VDRAEAALGALRFVDFQLEQVVSAEEAQERPQGADIPAPKALPDFVQKNGSEKNQAEEKSLPEGRVQGQSRESLGQRVAEGLEPDRVDGPEKGVRS
jgi:hypothetical protein